MDATGALIEPKSRAGRRAIPIIEPLRRELLQHHLSIGRRDGLVFGVTSTRPFSHSVVSRRAANAWRRAGLGPIGFHEARHTFASFLIAAGVNAKAISSYLGHASIQVTFDVYGHLMPGNEAEAAALLEGYLERAQAAARGRHAETRP
jgi:integrase